MGLFSLFTGKLGSGQPSTLSPVEPPRKPAARLPNKLSKPRTNTSSSNLLAVPSPSVSKKNSLVDLRGRRSSSLPPRTGEVAEEAVAWNKDAGAGRGRRVDREKRVSRLGGLFRSRSSQPASTVEAPEGQDIQERHWVKEQHDARPARVEPNPLHRYSQLGAINYANELQTDSQFMVHGQLQNVDLKRSPSYMAHHQTRLSLVAEAPSPAPTPVHALQHRAETEAILTGNGSIRSRNSNASKRHSMMSTPGSPLPVRANSVNSAHSEHIPIPIRRRSLLTPGIATRVEDVRHPPRQKLQKPHPMARRQSAAAPAPVSNQTFFNKYGRSQTMPSEEEIRSYYVDHNKPPESPAETLENLAALERPKFRGSAEMQRTSTPTDLKHIGSFKLGSLRIVNGAASPGQTPGERKARERERDYVRVQMAAMSLLNNQQMQAREPETEYDANKAEKLESKIDHVEVSAESPSRNATTRKPSVHLYQPDDSRTPALRLETAPQLPVSYQLVESYRLDMDFLASPFSSYDSMPSSPQLEATSKHMAEQDQLFEDEPNSAISMSSLTYEQQLSHPANGMKKNDERYLPDTYHRPQQRQAKIVQGSQQAPSKALAKTDSGYSSHDSLLSLKSHGSQPGLRDASRSPAPPAVPEKDAPLAPQQQADPVHSSGSSSAITTPISQVPAEPEMPLPPPRNGPPRADFWKTQHAPMSISKSEETSIKPVSAQEEVRPPAPSRVAPMVPPKSQVARPPIPQSTPAQEYTSSESEREPIKVVRYSVALQKRPDLTSVQRQTTQNVLQRATGRPSSALPCHNHSSSEDSMVSLKKRWHRSSARPRSAISVTVQRVEEPEAADVPPVPRRLSAVFRGRANKFPGLKQTKSAPEEAEKAEKEKPCPPPPIEEIERSIRRKSSPSPAPSVRSLTVTPHATPASSHPYRASLDGKSITSTSSQTSSAYQTRKDFEQQITSFGSVADALGANPYDAAVSAMDPRSGNSSQSSGSEERGRPARDRTGRVVGMDEASASRFARTRSQIRAREGARREALMALQGQDGRAIYEAKSNSRFAEMLAVQSGLGVGGGKERPLTVSEGIPPMPVFNVEDMRRQGLLKAKGKEKKKDRSAPPASAMRRRNSLRNVRHSTGTCPLSSGPMSPQLEMPERPAPDTALAQPPSAPPPPAAPTKRVTIATAPPTVILPSMAPRWGGPTPRELAEMAMAAHKEGRTSMDARRRSVSANGVYDRGGRAMGGQVRPSSEQAYGSGGMGMGGEARSRTRGMSVGSRLRWVGRKSVEV